MSKVVSLSVHKNTLKKRQTKEFVSQIKSVAIQGQHLGDELGGYAITIWDQQGNQKVFWNYDSKFKGVAFDDFIVEGFKRAVTMRECGVWDE